MRGVGGIKKKNQEEKFFTRTKHKKILTGLGEGELQAIFVDVKIAVIILLKNLVKKTPKLPCFVNSFLFFSWLILCKNKMILGP